MATEQLIYLKRVPKLPWLPDNDNGKRVHIATVYRWVHRGIRGTKLRAMRAGGAWVTTETWLKEFFAGLTGGSASPMSITPINRQRRRDMDAADDILDRACA